MGNIQLVDCTLGDGGYANDWKFGEDTIVNIISKLAEAHIDIIEIGILQDVDYQSNRTVFDSLKKANQLIDNVGIEGEYAASINYEDLSIIEDEVTVESGKISTLRVEIDLSEYMSDKREENLSEIMRQCKNIREKGYKLHILFTNMHLCNDEEVMFIVNMFAQIDVHAIYVVDSWGENNVSDALHYLKLLDQSCSQTVSIGYHGHNNLKQIQEIAQAIADSDFVHNILLDASIYGMGTAAGNLQTEIIAKYLNKHKDKQYDISKVHDVYYSDIRLINKLIKWGCSEAHLLTAQKKCNPLYADYFIQREMEEEEIRYVLNKLEPEKLLCFDEQKIGHILYELRKEKRSLAIVVPTCNRPQEINYWIQTIGKNLFYLGYDLIFYDSSSGDNIKLIDFYIEQSKLPNIKRMYYAGVVNGVLCNKVYDAAKEIAPEYDYIWIVRDRSVPNLSVVMPFFEKAYREKADFVVIYPHYLEPRFYGENIYTDCSELLRDFCGEMTSLGSIMFTKQTMMALVEKYPVDEHANYGLWLPIALFQYIGECDFKGYYFGNASFTYLPYNGSFWIKKSTLSWLFVKRWNEMIDLLPDSYNDVREEVRRFEGWALPPFNIGLLKQGRASGDLGILFLIKNWKDLKRCAGKHITKIVLLSFVPSILLKYYETHKNRFGGKLIYWLYKNIVKPIAKAGIAGIRIINSIIHVNKEVYPYSGVDYGACKNAFERDERVQSFLLEGDSNKYSEPYLSIVIPTNGRPETLKDAIHTAVNQNPVDYEWEIVVVDNQPYDGKVNKTQKYIKELNNDRIRYYRNEENLGAGGNMNRCVLLARGKWVTFLHDDDLLCADYLQRIQKIIVSLESRKKKPGLIFGDMYVVDYNVFNKNHYRFWNCIIASESKKYHVERVTPKECIYTGDLGFKAPTCGCTYLRDAYIGVGGMDEKGIGIEADFVLDFNILEKYEAYRCVCPFGVYRWGKNESAQKVEEIMYALYDLREYIYRKFWVGRMLKGVLRQEHTWNTCQVMGHLNDPKRSTTVFGLMRYYPNPLRRFFVLLIKKIYQKLQVHNRIDCSK